jgi:hypothetical protein
VAHWRRLFRPGAVRRVRRRTAMVADRMVAIPWKRFGPQPTSVPLDDDPRFALVTVNFSTSRYLKLLLLTLSDQEHLGLLHRIVVVDNGSRDGGAELLDRLTERVDRLHVVHRRRWLGHGPGMRAGVRALDHIEAGTERPANLLLFCDTDVVFRAPDALASLAGTALASRPALIGEVRIGVNPHPDIQASFFVISREVYARREVAPPVHDGSPGYRLQRSIFDAGLPVADVPTNHGGLLLHRGRAGVEAASRFRPGHHYAGLPNDEPHFMGVPDGGAIWTEIEQRHAALLEPPAEDELIDILAERFEELGTARIVD